MDISPLIHPLLCNKDGSFSEPAAKLYQELLDVRMLLQHTDQAKQMPETLKSQFAWPQKAAFAKFAHRVLGKNDQAFMTEMFCLQTYNILLGAMKNLKSEDLKKRQRSQKDMRVILMNILRDYEPDGQGFAFR